MRVDTPSLRMHQVAERPLRITTIAQVRVTVAAAFGTNRLTAHTIVWSTLLLDGYANSSSPNGAPSLEFDHHQPLSTVLLLCIRNQRLSLENLSGTRTSRCQPSRRRYRETAMRSACATAICAAFTAARRPLRESPITSTRDRPSSTSPIGTSIKSFISFDRRRHRYRAHVIDEGTPAADCNAKLAPLTTARIECGLPSLISSGIASTNPCRPLPFPTSRRS